MAGQGSIEELGPEELFDHTLSKLRRLQTACADPKTSRWWAHEALMEVQGILVRLQAAGFQLTDELMAPYMEVVAFIGEPDDIVEALRLCDRFGFTMTGDQARSCLQQLSVYGDDADAALLELTRRCLAAKAVVEVGRLADAAAAAKAHAVLRPWATATTTEAPEPARPLEDPSAPGILGSLADWARRAAGGSPASRLLAAQAELASVVSDPDSLPLLMRALASDADPRSRDILVRLATSVLVRAAQNPPSRSDDRNAAKHDDLGARAMALAGRSSKDISAVDAMEFAGQSLAPGPVLAAGPRGLAAAGRHSLAVRLADAMLRQAVHTGELAHEAGEGIAGILQELEECFLQAKAARRLPAESVVTAARYLAQTIAEVTDLATLPSNLPAPPVYEGLARLVLEAAEMGVAILPSGLERASSAQRLADLERCEREEASRKQSSRPGVELGAPLDTAVGSAMRARELKGREATRLASLFMDAVLSMTQHGRRFAEAEADLVGWALDDVVEALVESGRMDTAFALTRTAAGSLGTGAADPRIVALSASARCLSGLLAAGSFPAADLLVGTAATACANMPQLFDVAAADMRRIRSAEQGLLGPYARQRLHPGLAGVGVDAAAHTRSDSAAWLRLGADRDILSPRALQRVHAATLLVSRGIGLGSDWALLPTAVEAGARRGGGGNGNGPADSGADRLCPGLDRVEAAVLFGHREALSRQWLLQSLPPLVSSHGRQRGARRGRVSALLRVTNLLLLSTGIVSPGNIVLLNLARALLREGCPEEAGAVLGQRLWLSVATSRVMSRQLPPAVSRDERNTLVHQLRRRGWDSETTWADFVDDVTAPTAAQRAQRAFSAAAEAVAAATSARLDAAAAASTSDDEDEDEEGDEAEGEAMVEDSAAASDDDDQLADVVEVGADTVGSTDDDDDDDDGSDDEVGSRAGAAARRKRAQAWRPQLFSSPAAAEVAQFDLGSSGRRDKPSAMDAVRRWPRLVCGTLRGTIRPRDMRGERPPWDEVAAVAVHMASNVASQRRVDRVSLWAIARSLTVAVHSYVAALPPAEDSEGCGGSGGDQTDGAGAKDPRGATSGGEEAAAAAGAPAADDEEGQRLLQLFQEAERVLSDPDAAWHLQDQAKSVHWLLDGQPVSGMRVQVAADRLAASSHMLSPSQAKVLAQAALLPGQVVDALGAYRGTPPSDLAWALEATEEARRRRRLLQGSEGERALASLTQTCRVTAKAQQQQQQQHRRRRMGRSERSR